MEMKWKNMASIYANTDQLQKQLFTGNEMTVIQISENPQESSGGGVQL